MEAVYYQSSEKVRIIEELEHDYLIQDLETQTTYTIDKYFFSTHYEPMFNTEAYSQLKAQIGKLNSDTKHLRRANSKQKNELRKLRKELEKERKKNANGKPRFKNGKRGTIKNG